MPATLTGLPTAVDGVLIAACRKLRGQFEFPVFTGSFSGGRTVFSIYRMQGGKNKHKKLGFSALNWSRIRLWNRFTIRARNVLQAAEREAKLRNYDQIDTEHILCGLLADSGGGAAVVLHNLGIQFGKIYLEVDKRLTWRAVTQGNGRPARTEDVDRVLNSALDAAVELHDDYIGTEHLLLGLLRVEKGVAAQILQEIGLAEESARAEIRRAFPHGEEQAKMPAACPPRICLFTDAKRDFHLNIYRMAVAYYKPRIEKRAGVALGDIIVSEFTELTERMMIEIRREKTRWLPNIIWRFLFRRRLQQYADAIAASNANAGRKYTACYYCRGIYVSFESGVQHDEEAAATVVHELSHALWETLEGVPLHAQQSGKYRIRPDERRNHKLLVEGFAVYCERVWFLDLYPAHLRASVQKRPLGAVYERGFRHVKKLVEEHGPHVVAEIPKRWREFPAG